MKFKSLVILIALFISVSASVNDRYIGTINKLYVDPVDIVLIFDKNSKCGTAYFQLPSSNDNFERMYSLLLAASLSGKQVDLEVTHCSTTNKAIISHGSVILS
jgi:hypothetical protein